jgi:hypothetical protein
MADLLTETAAAAARAETCPSCSRKPGMACGNGWDHLSRYFRAKRQGGLETAALAAVTVAAAADWPRAEIPVSAGDCCRICGAWCAGNCGCTVKPGD